LLTGHDLNGDDIDDLGIAAKEAPGLDGSGDAGAVHVVFGKGM
jgi:hypothetical protein